MSGYKDRMVDIRDLERREAMEEKRAAKQAEWQKLRYWASKLGWQRFIHLQSGFEGWVNVYIIPPDGGLPVEALHDFYENEADFHEKEMMVQAGYRPRPPKRS